MKVKLTFTEPVLGTASSNPEIHSEFIASKAPDAKSMEEEVAAIGAEEVVKKSMTIFHRHNGKPCLMDYHLKGFMKDSCSALARVPGTLSNKLKAFKKIIDGTIFVFPRFIELQLPEGGQIGSLQRPLRAPTPQGERVALANSETCPAGTTITAEIRMLDPGAEKILREWLDYGQLRGLGQWRNASWGRFTWEEIPEPGNGNA